MKNQKYIQNGVNDTLILFKTGTKQQILNLRCKNLKVHTNAFNRLNEIEFESDEFDPNPQIDNSFLDQLNIDFDVLCKKQEPTQTKVEFYKELVIYKVGFISNESGNIYSLEFK